MARMCQTHRTHRPTGPFVSQLSTKPQGASTAALPLRRISMIYRERPWHKNKHHGETNWQTVAIPLSFKGCLSDFIVFCQINVSVGPRFAEFDHVLHAQVALKTAEDVWAVLMIPKVSRWTSQPRPSKMWTTRIPGFDWLCICLESKAMTNDQSTRRKQTWIANKHAKSSRHIQVTPADDISKLYYGVLGMIWTTGHSVPIRLDSKEKGVTFMFVTEHLAGIPEFRTIPCGN